MTVGELMQKLDEFGNHLEVKVEMEDRLVPVDYVDFAVDCVVITPVESQE